MIIQLMVAALATISFSILFSAPRTEYIYCGLTGSIGWFFYLIIYSRSDSIAFATFVAAAVVTIVSRIFAVNRRVPVIVFLIAGIFPLVPGTGIYFTAYNLFRNEMDTAGKYGLEAISIALTIAFGIMLIFLIPQKLFLIGKKNKKPSNLIKKWY